MAYSPYPTPTSYQNLPAVQLPPLSRTPDRTIRLPGFPRGVDLSIQDGMARHTDPFSFLGSVRGTSHLFTFQGTHVFLLVANKADRCGVNMYRMSRDIGKGSVRSCEEEGEECASSDAEDVRRHWLFATHSLNDIDTVESFYPLRFGSALHVRS